MNINARLQSNHIRLIRESLGSPTTIMESLNGCREVLHKTYWCLDRNHPLHDELRELWLRCAEHIDEFEDRHQDDESDDEWERPCGPDQD